MSYNTHAAIEALLIRLSLVVVLFGGGTAIGCANGWITSDAAGKHPITFAQVWGLSAR